MASFNPPTSQQGVTTTSLSHRTHWDQVGEAICPGAHKPGCWASRPCKVTALSIVSFSSFFLFIQSHPTNLCFIMWTQVPLTNYQSCQMWHQALLFTLWLVNQGKTAYTERTSLSYFGEKGPRRLRTFDVLKFSKARSSEDRQESWD